jgi:hypothetical protein
MELLICFIFNVFQGGDKECSFYYEKGEYKTIENIQCLTKHPKKTQSNYFEGVQNLKIFFNIFKFA